MKKVALLLLLPLMAVKGASAQSVEHVKLSTLTPAPGTKVGITYNPEGTPLAGVKDFDAMVYYMDNKDFPAGDISFKADGKLLKGSLTIPTTARAFFIRLYKDDATDSNDGKGYFYLVTKAGKPVEGANASKAYWLYSGMGASLSGIKSDLAAAATFYQKEFELYPQSKKEFAGSYTSVLVNSADPALKAKGETELGQLIKSGDEKQMITAANILTRQKKTAQADSLNTAIKAQFPNGTAVKNEMGMAFNREKDLAKKGELLDAYLKKFPENPTEKNQIQDNLRMQMAYAYLNAGKTDDYERVYATIHDKSNFAMYLNNVAFTAAKKGEKLDEAAKLSKQSLDLAKAKLDNPVPGMYQSPASAKRNAKESYNMYADTYAYILMKQGKFDEAIAYEKPVYEDGKGESTDINENYVLILNGAGKAQEATKVAENAVKTGKSTEKIDATLKELYIKTKGGDAGYDTYYAALKTASTQALRSALAKEIIKKPAPLFALKDLDGNTISLADLKGKIVVVDFWATWCGPCKASFPAMQLAVNKFKNNPNVKFVFIDTRETVTNYVDEVKKFITDNKYSFHVLFDDKEADGRQGKMLTAYDVPGIPTKFIIDAEGNIRFKHVGFDGSVSGLVDEVSTMIDMAMHPESISNSDTKTKVNAND